MNLKISLLSLVFSCSLLAGTRADEALDKAKKEAVASYAAIAGFVHADAHVAALAMQKALAEFTAAPTSETHTKAKDAWMAARLPYAQAEVFRVSDKDAAELDTQEAGGFKTIEFLLWGTDGNVDGPGARSYEDFVEAKDADAPKLKASAEKIVAALAKRSADWKADTADNRRANLVAGPADSALASILANIEKLSTVDLKKNRIGKAYESREQKDETSEYSDTTHLDLIYNSSGMANVIAGAYVGADKEVKVQGTGLLKLAETADAKQGEALKLAINRVMFAMTDFRPPFDRALMAPDDSPAREAIKEMMDALGSFSEQTAALGKKLGVEAVAPAVEEKK